MNKIEKLIQENPDLAEQIIDAYNDDVRSRLSRIETYLEYMFVVGQYSHTEQQGAFLASVLKKNPKDIGAMIAVEKLDNDQKMIEPRMFELAEKLFRSFEETHGQGKQFKFFTYKKPAPVTDQKSSMTINKNDDGINK